MHQNNTGFMPPIMANGSTRLNEKPNNNLETTPCLPPPSYPMIENLTKDLCEAVLQSCSTVSPDQLSAAAGEIKAMSGKVATLPLCSRIKELIDMTQIAPLLTNQVFVSRRPSVPTITQLIEMESRDFAKTVSASIGHQRQGSTSITGAEQSQLGRNNKKPLPGWARKAVERGGLAGGNDS